MQDLAQSSSPTNPSQTSGLYPQLEVSPPAPPVDWSLTSSSRICLRPKSPNITLMLKKSISTQQRYWSKGLHFLVPIIPANLLYLQSDVQVAVDGQYWVLEVMNGLGEEFVGCVLKEFLQEELRWGCQQRVLAVRGTDVLKGHYWCHTVRDLQWNQGEPLLTHLRHVFILQEFL